MHSGPEASNPTPPGIVGHLGIEETSEAVHDGKHLITDDRHRCGRRESPSSIRRKIIGGNAVLENALLLIIDHNRQKIHWTVRFFERFSRVFSLFQSSRRETIRFLFFF